MVKDTLLEEMNLLIESLDGDIYYYASNSKFINYKVGKQNYFDKLYKNKQDAITSLLLSKYGETEGSKAQIAVQDKNLNEKIYIYKCKEIKRSILLSSMIKAKIIEIEEITIQDFINDYYNEVEV